MSDAKYVLVMGNKNTSSWSLRPWLVLRRCGVDFDEELVNLRQENIKEILRERSPAGFVPFMKHGERVIWDSLSICEYLAEQFPGADLWPEDSHARSFARSISAEMHSGFAPMRSEMPMDFLGRVDGFVPDDAVAANIKRICEIWANARTQFGDGGPYLFGSWSIADAMFAPVVSRFRTYGIQGDDSVDTYMDAVCALPDWHAWADACRAELQQS